MPRTRKPPGMPGFGAPQQTGQALAPRAVPNQTYGAAGAQIAAQRALPMRAPSPAPSMPPVPGVGGAPTPLPSIPPGAFGPLERPTERPSEPVTAGAALGPGPGREALPTVSPAQSSMAQMLSASAQRTGSPRLAELAQRAAGA